MPSVLTRLLLFSSSYFPLTVVIAIVFFKKNIYLALGALLLGFIGLFGTLFYL